MNRSTSNQSLVFSLLLSVSPFAVCTAGAPEHEIADAQVKQALADLTKHDNEANKTVTEATPVAIVDLSKVNSSTEQPPLNFTAIESSINRIEYELADLKVHLADMKEAVASQARDEQNLRARLKAELEHKTTAAAVETIEEEATEESVNDVLDEDDDLDIDEEQDAVEIIAKECEEA